jgi:hypothetical protein
MTLALSLRADLFRAAVRFAPKGTAVRVEPVASGKGAVIAAWSEDAGLFIYDRSAVVLRGVEVALPPDFVEALAKAVRGSAPGDKRLLGNSEGAVTFDSHLTAQNAIVAPKISPWRAEIGRHGVTRIRQEAVVCHRDVMDDINEAARMLARAAGRTAHECERAAYVIRAGQEGALIVSFPDIGEDAFAVVGRSLPPADIAWSWTPPEWLREPRLGAVEGAAA